MGWVTFDYKCTKCDNMSIELVNREEVPLTLPCSKCGAVSERVFTPIAIAKVNMPQGGQGRFKDIKEQVKLKKEMKKADKKGDKAEKARIKTEMSKL